MWDFHGSMNDFNTSDDSGNITCFNETCLKPVDEAVHLRWGLLSLLALVLCTAMGNLLVCLAVCWDRRLQNMTNYFLMSLAIADFLVSLLVMPFGMIVEVHGFFPLEDELCAFWITMDVLMCTASIWHMCTMSMDRYFTLKYPMQYGRNKTKTMVALKITFVWAVSIAISSPICIYGFVDRSVVFTDGMCVPTLKEFVIYGSVFAFYIPLSIMILTYLLTIRILWQNQNLMRTIDRSDFRLKPRTKRYYNNNGKSYRTTKMLSPPSSDSRRDSHTELSSLTRTPNPAESRSMLTVESNGINNYGLTGLSGVSVPPVIIDNAYKDTHCTAIPPPSSPRGASVPNTTAVPSSSNSTTEITVTSIPETNMDNNDNTDKRMSGAMDCSLTVPSCASVTDAVRTVPVLTLNSNEEISSSQSLARFRSRTNTDIGSNFPTTYSSLKLPKNPLNLQGSVSCSNFARNCDNELGLFKSMVGGALNRDYKSLEWSQHFYEIQQEMDQCLRESRSEKRELMKAMSDTDLHSDNSTSEFTSIQKDELKPEFKAMALSDSGESMDDVDSSSDNTSDLLTIKLYPKSVYMYKLDVPKDSAKVSRKPSKKNRVPNGIAKRRLYQRANSGDSDKSNETISRVRPAGGSFRKFIKHIRHTTPGFKQHNSNKTATNERKASKVLGIIFAVFVILWTPFFTVNILSVTCTGCMKYVTPELMSVFLWMGYIASLANPIIYTMFNTAFRRAFIKILSCHICKHGTLTVHRVSIPSSYLQASVCTERRQTVTMLFNNNANDIRIPSDFGSNYSR